MRRSLAAGVVDTVLEATVVPSFTRVGYAARRRLEGWTSCDEHDLTGRSVLVTGATSGLGLSTATACAGLGATVIVTGREQARAERTAAAIDGSAIAVAADMGEPDDVRRLAAAVGEVTERLDVLIHNAGALTRERRVNSVGIESTVASQVVGPFLLTSLLLRRLGGDRPGRVVTVSSGGMYAAPVTVDRLQMPAGDYSGSDQYARAKRAQVTLNEIWATKQPASQVVFSAMHPGWADTPGVRSALPTFRAATRPLLRSAAEGADTIVWLACDPEPGEYSGGFWHDRQRRSIHRLPRTRRSDTPERRAQLWDWCVRNAGIDPGELS